MSRSIISDVCKPGAAVKFTSKFIEGYLNPAFGTRSKSEIDLLVFSALIAAGTIDPDQPTFDIARMLNITPARVRGLLLNWQLRSSAPSDIRQSFAKAVRKTRFAKDGTLLTFGIENPLLREEIIASLKRKGFYADASFSKEMIRLPVEALVEFLEEILDEKTKNDVCAALVKDKLLPDKSFKALATAVLTKLGEKVAGEVGKEVAGDLVGKVAKPMTDKAISFMSGLLSGDGKSAAKALSKEDFPDVA
ncbi:MAG: hypothetical protein KA171_02040 [Reyranella sp.]|nr:hypothetical protein [Reyranella sp.]